MLGVAFTGSALAQDIEPRRWTPLPIGTNLVGIGVIHTEGEIAFDPVLKIEDARVEAKTVVASFLHAFDFLGKSARFDLRVPLKRVRWKGLLDGQPRSVQRRGLGDPRLRWSVNLLGAPALRGEDFRAYRAAHRVNTVVGAALAITLPLGEYKREKLLNLGGNRFVIRPQLGIVHTRGPWSFELTGSAFFYAENEEFFGESVREQDPLFALQGHLIYVSAAGWWASLGAAHDWGGRSIVDGTRKDDRKRDLLFGISGGFPLGKTAGVKIAYVGSRTQEKVGSDTDSLALAVSIRF